MIRKPQPNECNNFYQPYINKIGNKNMLDAFKEQYQALPKTLTEKAEYRYAAGK